jgi:aminomethyltransferase
MIVTDAARRTPLHDCHVEAGARLVEFAGWRMPVQYSGVIDEHRAVRSAAGLFDVSHMGEIRVAGPRAEEALQRLTPNNIARLRSGRAHYSSLLTERGTFIDDLLVYRLSTEEFMLVVNAVNASRDRQWIAEQAGDDVEVSDVSDSYALLALQGPRAEAILQQVTDEELTGLKYYRFAHTEADGRRAIISRTGYTGEDGFEIYTAPADAPDLWRRLLVVGTPLGLVPAGLGARDTLRLEAAMALYGHELDDSTTPLEASLEWTVKWSKGDFIGRDALLAQRTDGPARRLTGFEISDRGIARQGSAVLIDGTKVGVVTSGTWSPTLERAIGMAYLAVEYAVSSLAITLEVRGRELAGHTVELPFYRRG